MNRRSTLIYLGLPMLYLGFLLLLLVVQFSGGSLFSDSLGSLNLSGVFELSGEEETESLSSLSLEVQGLKLAFDKNRPLELRRDQGQPLLLEAIGYQKTTEGFQIQFEQGVILESVRDADTEQVVFRPRIPQQLGAYRAIVIPYEVSGGNYALTENYPGLDISYQGDRYILSLPPRSLVLDSDRQLVVSTLSLTQDIRYTPRTAGNEDIYDLWFQNRVASVSREQFVQGVQTFVNSAYTAWRGVRYNAVAGTWSHRNGGSPAFRESILIALLSEAWNRNDYARAYTEMRTAADLHPNSLTFRSAPFMGNLRQISAGLEADMRPELLEITNLINQRNADLLLIPGFIQTAANHGTAALVSSLQEFVQSINPQVLTSSQRAGLLSNLLLYPQPIAALRELEEVYLPFIETDLLPLIIRVDEGLFFQREPGIAESRETIQVGYLLQMAGEAEGDERFTNLGRQLVLSVLGLADDQGFIPERIEFTAGAISGFNRFTGPEELYALVSTNPHRPRQTSLFEHFGAGSFVYSIATLDQISVNRDFARFDVRTTPNRTHYMIMRGIPPVDPLSGMELFGITYRDAADFEIYSRGRYYNPSTRTLMIKYFDDLESERIVIYR